MILPSSSPGLLWEVQQLIEAGLIAHTVWIMPPADALPSGETEWNAGRAALAACGLELPAFSGAGGFVILDAAGRLRHRAEFRTLWQGGFADMVRKYLWRGLPPRRFDPVADDVKS